MIIRKLKRLLIENWFGGVFLILFTSAFYFLSHAASESSKRWDLRAKEAEKECYKAGYSSFQCLDISPDSWARIKELEAGE